MGWGGVKTNFLTPPMGGVNLGWGDFASLPQALRSVFHSAFSTETSLVKAPFGELFLDFV